MLHLLDHLDPFFPQQRCVVEYAEEKKLKDDDHETVLPTEEPRESAKEVVVINEDLIESLDILKAFFYGVLMSVTKSQQFDGKFLIVALNVLSEQYEAINKQFTLNYSRVLCEEFFKNISNLNSFPDHFLTQFGYLKVSSFKVF